MVLDQFRAWFRQPEIIVGTWLSARGEASDVIEAKVRDVLTSLDLLWDKLFPAEQARLVAGDRRGRPADARRSGVGDGAGAGVSV